MKRFGIGFEIGLWRGSRLYKKKCGFIKQMDTSHNARRCLKYCYRGSSSFQTCSQPSANFFLAENGYFRMRAAGTLEEYGSAVKDGGRGGCSGLAAMLAQRMARASLEDAGEGGGEEWLFPQEEGTPEGEAEEWASQDG